MVHDIRGERSRSVIIAVENSGSPNMAARESEPGLNNTAKRHTHDLRDVTNTQDIVPHVIHAMPIILARPS